MNDDSVIVSMTIAKHPVKRILVDSGSSVDILTYDAFIRMNLSPNFLQLVIMPLVGFTEDSVRVEGEITLPIMVGSPPCQSTVLMRFLVAQVPLAYNVILDRLGLNLLDAVISTKCLLVRFSTSGWIREMHGEKNPMQICYHMAPSPQKMVTLPTSVLLNPRESERRGEPTEHLLSYPLGDDPGKTVQIDELLPLEIKNQLLTFLWANTDVFA